MTTNVEPESSVCPKFNDDFAENSADNAATFGGAAGESQTTREDPS